MNEAKKTIRALLLAAVAEARAAGLPVRDIEGDVYEGRDDAQRPTLFLGKRVREGLVARGVVFGDYPGGGSFFLDVDGVRVRVGEAKPVVRPKLPPGFLEGLKPKARDAFGDVVDDEHNRPANRRERRAQAAEINRRLERQTKNERAAAHARGRELRRQRQKLAAGLEALAAFFCDDARGRSGPSRGLDLHADLSLFGEPFTATTVIPADHAPPSGSLPVVFRDFLEGDDALRALVGLQLKPEEIAPGSNNSNRSTVEASRPAIGELRLDAKKLAAVMVQPDRCPACGGPVAVVGEVLGCCAAPSSPEEEQGCGWFAPLVEVAP